MGFMKFSFMSKTLGYHTNVYLIIPADQFPNRDKSPREVYGELKKFPTLYLLHGGSGNGLDWTRFTSIERYANDHHIAVVMPEVLGDCFYTDMVHGNNYFTYISEELPVVMERNFPLSPKREDRFVAGLSMGGYGAFKWAFRKPEFFSAAANLSGASLIVDLFSGDWIDKNENSVVNNCFGSLDRLRGSEDDTKFLIDRAAAENTDLPALYAAIGTEDFSYDFTRQYVAYAESKGLKIKYEEGPGFHDWKFWDEYIQRVLNWLPIKKLEDREA